MTGGYLSLISASPSSPFSRPSKKDYRRFSAIPVLRELDCQTASCGPPSRYSRALPSPVSLQLHAMRGHLFLRAERRQEASGNGAG